MHVVLLTVINYYIIITHNGMAPVKTEINVELEAQVHVLLHIYNCNCAAWRVTTDI
jgi:hypothetical protein